MVDTKKQTPADAWWLKYPTVKSHPDSREADVVEDIMKTSDKVPGKDYAVIDVRGTDRVGGHVKGSYNYRAQDFYPQIEEFGERFKAVPDVFFYCSSSNGRAPRVAGWYQDWLDAHGVTSSTAWVLAGGIKGWLKRNADDKELTEDYDPVLAASAK